MMMKDALIESVGVLILVVLPTVVTAQDGSAAGVAVRPAVVAPFPLISPPVVRSAPLRAAPLPPDTLARPGIGAAPARSTYSMPYGPNLTRPSGSVVVPFGSSRYY